MTNPGTLNSRLAKWGMLMSQYSMTFVPQKAVKGQAIADFLAAHPVPDTSKLYEELPDEITEANATSKEPEVWQMYFDGASRSGPHGRIIAGVGVVFISPNGHVLPRAFSLTEPCSNNVAEYNALLVGLQIAKELGVQYLEAYGDSQLIVNQVTGEYEARNEDLVPYYQAVLSLANSFDGFYISHIPRLKNTEADALASLAATLALPITATYGVKVTTRHLLDSKHNLDIKEVNTTSMDLEPRDWRFPFIDYALYDILPEDPTEATSIRRRAPRFHYNPEVKMLYRRSLDGVLIRCLSQSEGLEVIKEAHDGICGAHQPGPKLHERVQRLGYYWPTMIADAVAYAKKCKACQIHANFMHQPPEQLHPTAASWPFEAWGMDIVGPITPPSAKGHRYILAITDYFSKWAEAVPLAEVKTMDVVNFVKHHVIYRFGVPRRIIHDNGPQFASHAFYRFCNKFRIQNVASTAYYPAANGLAEAFNKTIIKLLKKFVSTSKRDWNERLGECLWAYRTTVRTATGCTPFSLTYGCEAVLPLEIQIPSLRIALATRMTEAENDRLRLQELEALDEKRLRAQQSIELYQARISRAVNKKVKQRVFQKGDLVLAVRRPMIMTHKTKGKFQPKWEGPFIIETVYSNGAYRLANQKGETLMMPINGKFLKKYYS